MAKSIVGDIYNTQKFECYYCDKRFTGQVWAYINAAEKPSLKKQILAGELLKTRCPHCGKFIREPYEFLYVDPVSKAVIALHFKTLLVYIDSYFLSKFHFLPSNLSEYKLRVVTNYLDLSEKAVIFDFGLDDRVIQFLKEMIEFDRHERGEKAPREIRFTGLVSNFKQTMLQFKLTIEQKEQAWFWDESQYRFSAKLIEKYAEDFHKKGWLVINNYFPKHFMDLAFEKYRKEEFRLLISKTETIRRQIATLLRMKKHFALAALINSSPLSINGCTLYFDFSSEILASKAREMSTQLASIAEEVIGFKPDIVCRVINARHASSRQN